MTNRVVFKYPLETSNGPGPFDLQLPVGSELLSMGAQDYRLVAWALVNQDTRNTKVVHLELAWTGSALIRRPKRFIGTATMQGLVWHLFEVEPM